MIIRGLQPFSLLDFPGRISCIIFVGNCNFRCPYCHNPSLVFDPESQPEVTSDYFWNFMERRRGRLDGIVISGGEPTLRHDLPEFVKQLKAMDFMVKLDSNGTNPEMIQTIHENSGIDYLAIDYKAPADRYSMVTSNPGHATKVGETIRYAVSQKIPLEIRTTVHKDLLKLQDFYRMRRELDSFGAALWYLQQFNITAPDLIDESLTHKPTYSDNELLDIADQLGGKTFARGLNGLLVKHRGMVRI